MITTIPLGHRLTSILEAGQHPATGEPILPDFTCGSCAHRLHRQRPDGTSRSKCDTAAFPRGGPNLPAHTPACQLFTPTDAAPEQP